MAENKPQASSSSSSTPAEGKPRLSNYGDPDQRQFPPLLSMSACLLTYAMYQGASMLPLILLSFGAAVYFGVIPSLALQILAALICLDYAIPLPNGYKPNIERKQYFERLFAEGMQHYFPARSIFLPKTLQKDQAYILAAWPHSLMGGGGHVGLHDFGGNGAQCIYTGATVIKYVPIVRRFLHTLGFTEVTKSGLNKVLKKENVQYPYNVVHLVVGGIHEMFYTPIGKQEQQQQEDNFEQIILHKRKGFIKLALQNQCDILPYYCFGANQMYGRVFSHKSLLCRISSTLQISLVVWLGRWNIPMGWMPYPIPLLGVTGNVFSVPRVNKPEDITDELVQQVHADFCQALKELFDTYKKVYVEEMGADPMWLTRELKLENE